MPVLKHDAMKPSRKCIRSIKDYYRSLRPPNRLEKEAPFKKSLSSLSTSFDTPLIIVGDRVLTDVLMGNHPGFGTRDLNLTVLTQRVWVPEGIGMGLLRRAENLLAGWASRREEVKEYLAKYTKFAKLREEVLGVGSGAIDSLEKAGRETVWEGKMYSR